MTEVKRFQIEEDGKVYTINVATQSDLDLPPAKDAQTSPDREEYSIDTQTVLVHMVEVHEAIDLYTRYAIGAFKNLANEHIEEVTVKFGLKIGGKTGIPFIAEATSEGNLEIEVKCKF